MALQKCTDEDILNFIREYTAAKDWPPSKREIADGCGIVASAVHRRLLIMHQRRVIEIVPHQARSIRVLG